MIDEIQVKNVALIREAKLVPSRAMTVLTGETGAGKTALLSAFKLLCGERADAGMVREGTGSLSVEGRLFCGGDTEGTVISRRVGADGRSRVAINGAMASVGELAARVGSTVDLCGQHEHQRLLSPATHPGMLDAWAQEAVLPLRASYQAAYDQVAEAQDNLDRIEQASSESHTLLDEARFTLRQIDAAAPVVGEYEELAGLLARAEHAEALARASDTAHTALAGEGGAIDAVHAAVSALGSAQGVDEGLAGHADVLREATYLLEDVAREALRYRDSIDFDPETLAASQERFAALQGLMRAFGPGMEEVFARREAAADLVSMVDDFAERRQEALTALEEAEAVLQDAAGALAAARGATAPRFARAVSEQMARLEMGGASLECSCTDLARTHWTRSGSSQVEFLFCPAAGLTPRPLARIASGGEVSRVMLAIKVVLGQSDEVDTLVFDEVDAGVGGTTAVALAAVLSDLARSHQVIVVTHLPQVAVAADVHYRVVRHDAATPVPASKKAVQEGAVMPETVLEALGGHARTEEIARMLSGKISKTSVAHAEELLAAQKPSG